MTSRVTQVKMRLVIDPSPNPLASAEAFTDERSSLKSSFKQWERLCWLVALALGLLQAWGRRHNSADGLAYMGADGISYLDIGDAYMRGDWYVALNAMWSPFYSWMVGITLRLFKPSPFWEFTVVRLLNFIIYSAALFSFAFFLRQLRRVQQHNRSHATPDWSWLVFGYTIFIWTSLFMNRVSRTSPDLLVSALIFLACALLLKTRANASQWRLFVLLGVVLGIGYLSKTIMFPLAFVFSGCAFLLTRRTVGLKAALLRTATTLIVFFTLVTPFVVVISRAKQRFTIGDTARLNYAWYVNGATRFIHWQGEPASSGTPLHPTRKIFASPGVYEFAGPPGVSYPPWYDPSYWYEGVAPHFSLRQQLSALWRNLVSLYGFISLRFFLVAIVFALFVLLYQTGSWRVVLRNLSAYWYLVVPSLTGIALYLLINVEARYLAPFVVLLVMSCFASVRLSATAPEQRLMAGVSLGLVLFFLAAVVPQATRAAYSTARELSSGAATAVDIQWQVADELHRNGMRQGDRVASIGNTMYAAWPRLARLRVVAEVPEIPNADVREFWAADQKVRLQILAAMAGTGARVVVAENAPRSATLEGWQRLGNTDYYIYPLSR